MESFGSLLGRLLQDQNISASELSRRMGLRSKTTLQRILRDQSNHDTVLRLWEQLQSSGLINIPDGTRRDLDEALEVLRLSPEVYRTFRAMGTLLHVQEAEERPIRVTGIEDASTFAQLSDIYAAARSLEITIIGLCDLRIFQSLQRMCSRIPADHQPHICHYIFRIADASETIRNVCAVFPILFHRNYNLRMVPLDGLFADRHFPGEMLLCRFTDAQDKVHYHQLAFSGPSQMHAIAYPDSAAYDYWQTLIQANGRDLPPIKSAYRDEHSPDDYLTYIEDIRALEQNSNLYMLKPDIPISLVPPQTLFSAVTGGSEAASFISPEQLQVMAGPLIASHTQRHNHLFHRRKVTHMILSRSAMLQFAQTGRKSDHFYSARPYTPAERVEILTLCLNETMNNPYFNIYFSASDALIHDAEICLYEGKGTVLLNAHTSYRLADDHSEALITHDGFNQQFRRYYVNELLRRYVLPAAEGHAYLRSLIDVARQSE